MRTYIIIEVMMMIDYHSLVNKVFRHILLYHHHHTMSKGATVVAMKNPRRDTVTDRYIITDHCHHHHQYHQYQMNAMTDSTSLYQAQYRDRQT